MTTTADIAADLDAMLATLRKLRGRAEPDAEAAAELDYFAARMRWLARQEHNRAFAPKIRAVARACAAAASALSSEHP
jgi:hypothetical protein